MNIIRSSLSILSLVLSLFITNSTLAADSEIKFSGFVTDITQPDINSDEGTITVTLYDFEVLIVVNLDTEIQADAEEIGLADLTTDDFVKIEAFFAPEGIIAEEIGVLDNDDEQFRVRGTITATTTLDDITTITVMSIDMNADGETDITRRGSGNGNNEPASELVIGDLVNVSGGIKDDFLYAERIHVGSRPQGNIELEGEIIAIIDDTIQVAIEGGTLVTVIIDENTSVSGDLELDAFVEVEGQLNEFLEVVGFEIVVDEDGDGDADDDNRRGRRGDNNPGNGPDNGEGLKVESKISLESDTESIEGSAKFKYVERGDRTRQSVEVEIEDGDANTDYTVILVFADTEVEIGTLTTDGEGEGEIELETDDDGEDTLTALLPDGSDVRDITGVIIVLDDSVVLEGSF